MSASANGNGKLPAGHFEEPVANGKRQLTPEEMKAKTEEMRVVNDYRLACIESNVIMESYGAYGWDRAQGFGGSDTTEFYLRMRQQAGGLAIPPSQPGDRRGGAKWPVWRTDVELNRLRQASRVLCASNDYAKGLLRNQTNYTIGKGFQYKAGPKHPPRPHVDDPGLDQATNEQARKEALIKKKGIEKIVDAVQRWIDDFCARNNWNTAASPHEVAEDGSVGSASSTREREAHWRVDRDGEAIIRLFCREDGKVDVRFVGPEMVWGEPIGKSGADGWSYGMQHLVVVSTDDECREVRCDDLERICNYYIRPHEIRQQQYDKRHDAGGEIVPAREIVHIKDPWEDAEVKRGTPVFAYDTFDAISRATNLQRNVSITSSVQAATAEIWKHTIGTKSQIESLQNGPLARTVNAGDGSQRVEQRIFPGMIRRVPQGQEPVEYPGSTRVPEYQSAAQGDLRQAGASQSAPEFLVSGDASNGNFACHDSETELLTKRGWLRHDQIVDGDEAGTMNPETGEFEWQAVTAVHVYDYDGPMVKISGSHNLDLLVTPNHRMYAARHRSERPGGRKGKISRVGIHPFEFVRADELKPGSILPLRCNEKAGIPVECFEIPPVIHQQTGKLIGARTIPMRSFIPFLGWWVSEGWTVNDSPGYAVGIAQDNKAKHECMQIETAAVGLRSSGYNVHRWLSKYGMNTWQINDKGLWTWLRNNAGIGSYNKRLPEFVNDLPAIQQSELLEALCLGDGQHRESGSRDYFTVSKKLADQVQSLAIQCGHISHTKKMMRSGVIPVGIKNDKYYVKVSANHISQVPYSGTVWCVTVPNSLVVTRRNGKSIITGNSISEAGVPYVRAAESRQEHFKTAFLRLMWRVISYAVKCKALPEEALTVVDIAVEGMEIAKNNEGELATSRAQNLASKVTSPQIECAKLGNDPQQVIADWKEWEKETAPPQQAPGGGAPGPKQPGLNPPLGKGYTGDDKDALGRQYHWLNGKRVKASEKLASVPQEDLSGADVQESLDASGTGEVVDKLGRKTHWVNHKQVKGQEEVDAAKGTGGVTAKVDGQPVTVQAHDAEHGLAKVKDAKGVRVVPVGYLDFGDDEDAEAALEPAKEETAKAAPEKKPAKVEDGPPKHGQRANEVAAKRKELAELHAKVKAMRVDAFNEAKKDAQDANDNANGFAGEIARLRDKINFDSDTDDRHNELDVLVSNYEEDGSAADRFNVLKDIEVKAKECLDYDTKRKDKSFITDDLVKENKDHLQSIIDNARAARAHLKEYVKHRKEMQAIKAGEPMDVQESMQDDGAVSDWAALLESMESPEIVHRGQGWLDFGDDDGWVEIRPGGTDLL